jgi:hypothetical protein
LELPKKRTCRARRLALAAPPRDARGSPCVRTAVRLRAIVRLQQEASVVRRRVREALISRAHSSRLPSIYRCPRVLRRDAAACTCTESRSPWPAALGAAWWHVRNYIDWPVRASVWQLASGGKVLSMRPRPVAAYRGHASTECERARGRSWRVRPAHPGLVAVS